ncbi:latrophilin Cirl-like isoform X2 [Centruroides vittatus]|uniref:latrophilin Cirl-like isoform X2 n=1 Tax=Centruroides vittatus TaxID=120091 RepID=UPI00350EEB65
MLCWWAALLSLLTTVAARRGVSLSSFSLRPPLLERLNYITTYACEERELRVGCENGGLIKLVRANYGRFSISICNDHGNLDWSVNCMSYRSFLIMQDRCSLKPSCSVVVSSNMFGDPCPGTLKYLEVQYHCVSGSGTTPGKLNSLLNMGNNTNETTIERTESATPTSTMIYPSSSPLSSSVTLEAVTSPYLEQSIANTNTSVATTDTLTKETSSKQPIGNGDLNFEFREGFCMPVVSRDLFWNWTKGGDFNVQKCPGGSSGLAKWHCGVDPIRWSSDVPDLQECKSFWVENLRRRMEEGESVISVATELALMTVNKAVFSEDLKDVSDVIQQTLTRTVNSMENFLDMWHRYHVLRELLQSLLETVSNLLEDDQLDAWEELSSSDRRQVTSSLLGELEESALLLADASGQDDSFTIAKNNVLLSVQVLNTRSLKSVQFPILEEFKDDNASTAWIRMEDSLLLPAQALADMSRHGLAKVVFMAYSRVGEFLKPEFNYHPRSLSRDLSAEEESPRNITRIVNSRVIAASVGKHGMIRLTQPVIITLKHLQEDNVTNPYCVYWDFHEREWSGQGCWVQHFNRTHTICACDHLTNFAVIMDVKPIMEYQGHKDMMKIIITIGCTICILCLLITVFLLFLLRNLTGDNIIIHRNLFLCLLISEIIFLGGIDQTTYHIICSTIAGLLHYFLLVTFAWASLEGFQYYIMLTEMVEPEKSRGCWYYLLAYGVPIIIVAISATVDPYSYGTEKYCWLRADNYFTYSFIGPAVGILFGGSVFLIIAISIMCQHSNLATTVKGKEEAKLASIRSWIRLAIILFCLLVLTWTTGLLYANRETIFLAYIFMVVNTLQGLYILVFYSFGSIKVREELRKFLHQRGLLSLQVYSPKSEDALTSHQPNGTVPAVSSPSQHSIPPESWSLPKEENSSIVLKFTTPGLPYTTVPNSQEAEKDNLTPNVAKELKKFSYNIQPVVQRYSKSSEAEVYVSNSNTATLQNWPQEKWYRSSPYQPYSDICTPYVDHIYESIENHLETPENRFYASKVHQNFERCCSERSDLSQHSLLNYGPDQHSYLTESLTLKRHTRSPLPQQIYGDSKTYSSKSPEMQKWYRHERHHRSHQRSSSDKLPNDVIQIMNDICIPNNEESQRLSSVDNVVFPDLLKCRNSSEVMGLMAVMDREKVKSCLPSYNTELNYKLSTGTPC